jgi:hypothetical protein
VVVGSFLAWFFGANCPCSWNYPPERACGSRAGFIPETLDVPALPAHSVTTGTRRPAALTAWIPLSCCSYFLRGAFTPYALVGEHLS